MQDPLWCLHDRRLWRCPAADAEPVAIICDDEKAVDALSVYVWLQGTASADGLDSMFSGGCISLLAPVVIEYVQPSGLVMTFVMVIFIGPYASGGEVMPLTRLVYKMVTVHISCATPSGSKCSFATPFVYSLGIRLWLWLHAQTGAQWTKHAKIGSTCCADRWPSLFLWGVCVPRCSDTEGPILWALAKLMVCPYIRINLFG